MPEPHLRAADTDREAVATALGEHMAAGRLTPAEYDERVAGAWAARTYGELAELTADLPPPAPAPGPVRRPVAGPCGASPTWAWGARPVPWHGARPEDSWRAWLATSVTVLAVYLVVSLATWDLSYFWPMWVIGPWGAALLARGASGTRRVDAARRG